MRLLTTILALGLGMTATAVVADVEADKQRLAQTIRAGDWAGMRQQADALRSRGVDLGTEILYFEGRGALEQDDLVTAERKLAEYTGRGPRVQYYTRALERLQTVRGKLAEAEAARAAVERLRAAQARWLQFNAIARIEAVDEEWGFVTLSVPDAHAQRPLMLVAGDSVRKFGPLKQIGPGRYTATLAGGVRGATPGAEVHACCRPEEGDAGSILEPTPETSAPRALPLGVGR